MPPQVSDGEMDSDGPEEVPSRAPAPKFDEEQDEEEDDDDEDGEEYRVEKVLSHKFVGKKNEVFYEIKWLGYEKKSDRTWEPVGNLENAMEAVNEYHESLGGAPVPPSSSGNSKRKAAGASSTPVKGTKRPSSALYEDTGFNSQAKKRRDLNGASTPSKLPPGPWEDHVQRVHTVLEEDDSSMVKGKNKNGKVLLGLIEWNDGRKTQHPLSVLRRKCPQRMLDYYEQHLVFRTATAKDDAQADAAETIDDSL